MTEDPFARLAFLPGQVRREAASVNADSGGQSCSWNSGERRQDVGEINQVLIDRARRDVALPMCDQGDVRARVGRPAFVAIHLAPFDRGTRRRIVPLSPVKTTDVFSLTFKASS